jgi:hypothetical protein
MPVAYDIDAAIESARRVHGFRGKHEREAQERKYSTRTVRAIALALLEELPDDMTISDLRDELAIGDDYGCCLSG